MRGAGGAGSGERERERVSQMSESVQSGGMIRHSEYQGVISYE